MPDTPYFTVAEFRDEHSDVPALTFPDAKVEEKRAVAEQAFETACGKAFVPRQATDTLIPRAAGARTWTLPQRPARRVISAADELGATLDVTDATLIGQIFTAPSTWPSGPIALTYEHGLDAPPLREKYAVMLLTKVLVTRGPVDERATQIATENGGRINLATPGMFGAEFGVPEVDQVVRRHANRAVRVL